MGTLVNFSHQGRSGSLSWLFLVKIDFRLWAQMDSSNPAAGPLVQGRVLESLPQLLKPS